MLAMRLPERLASDDAADERDRRIGEIIERQDDGRRQIAVRGKSQQEPAEHEADRQAAHVAKKHACDRLVEGRKAKDRSQERGRHHRRPGLDRAGEAEQDDCTGHRYKFGNGHPVDAVHEIDEVDQPYPAEKKAGTFEPPRYVRQGAQLMGEGRDEGADGDALYRQPYRRG
jgi:hypothetical protein